MNQNIRIALSDNANRATILSHYFRTPITAIAWHGEMLMNGDLGELSVDQQRFIQNILASNQRLSEVVNSLIDVAGDES